MQKRLLQIFVEIMAYDFQSNNIGLSPENAEKQLDRLEKQILSLDEMPERFPRYGKEPWYSRGLRFVSIDNYIVFYIPDIEEQTVTILRVMYSGRNIEEQLSIHTKQ